MLRDTYSHPRPNRAPLLLAIALLLLAPMAASGEPSVGEPAPDFSLRGSDGELHSLQAILASGKQGVVLAWFPKAFTPG